MTFLENHYLFFRRGIPLLLLPEDVQTSRQVLDLYLPQTGTGRIAKCLLEVLVRFRLHKKILPSSRSCAPFRPYTSVLQSILDSANISHDATFGALLCNPCHGIRCVVVLQSSEKPPRVLKIAEVARSAPIRTEYETLCRLSPYPGVPKVGRFVQTSEAVWFDMEFLWPAKTGTDVAELLRTWESEEEESWEDNALFQAVRPYLLHPEKYKGGRIRRALVHGDFTPWNLRKNAQGKNVAIDWEWAEEDGIAGFDALYCKVQTALLVHHVPMSQLRKRLSLSEDDELLLEFVLAYRKMRGMV